MAITQVRGLGLMWGLELAAEGAPVVAACRERGLLLNCTQGNVIRLLPPLVITPQELDAALAILAGRLQGSVSMTRHLLTILDLSREEIEHLLARARELKVFHKQGQNPTPLKGKTVAMIFDKPSTRTRVSFEAGIAQLGGASIYLAPGQTQMSRNEPVADTARVLSRYVDGVVVRTFAQETVAELARHATIPVINGLTDTHHPCQVFSDLMTMEERFGDLTGLKVAWVGDGNNMANSWITAAMHLDFALYLACPPGYEPDAALLAQAQAQGARVYLGQDPQAAVAGAHGDQHRRLGLHGPGGRGRGPAGGL